MKQAVILLIEDNEQNRYLATFLLEQHGYRVVSASDGLIGIKTAKQLQPDLILLDIQLPIMDGYAVAQALRRIPELRRGGHLLCDGGRPGEMPRGRLQRLR